MATPGDAQTSPAAMDATLGGVTAPSSGPGEPSPGPRDTAAGAMPPDPWTQGQDPWARPLSELVPSPHPLTFQIVPLFPVGFHSLGVTQVVFP